jgi:hypothetical protein
MGLLEISLTLLDELVLRNISGHLFPLHPKFHALAGLVSAGRHLSSLTLDKNDDFDYIEQDQLKVQNINDSSQCIAAPIPAYASTSSSILDPSSAFGRYFSSGRGLNSISMLKSTPPDLQDIHIVPEHQDNTSPEENFSQSNDESSGGLQTSSSPSEAIPVGYSTLSTGHHEPSSAQSPIEIIDLSADSPLTPLPTSPVDPDISSNNQSVNDTETPDVVMSENSKSPGKNRHNNTVGLGSVIDSHLGHGGNRVRGFASVSDRVSRSEANKKRSKSSVVENRYKDKENVKRASRKS